MKTKSGNKRVYVHEYSYTLPNGNKVIVPKHYRTPPCPPCKKAD